MCYILAFIGPAPFVVEIFILVLLACYRVRALHRANNFSADPQARFLKVIMRLVWFLGLMYSFVLMFAIKDNTAVYVPIRFRCAPSNFSNPRYKLLNNVLTCIVILIPMMIIVGTNMFILIKISIFRIKRSLVLSDPPTFYGWVKTSFRKRDTVQSKQKYMTATINRCNHGNTAMTISLICCVFVISYTPLLVFIVLRTPHVPDWFQLFFTHCLSINITVNPFIYALRNVRFRNYVMNLCFP